MSVLTTLLLAVTNGEVILIVAIIAIPIAGISFILGSGRAFDQIGKGGLSLDLESDAPQGIRDSLAEAPAGTAQQHQEEVRQLLEAKAFRQSNRGEQPLDVDAELERLIGESETAARIVDERGLREEIRQLVIARNARRRRQGKPALDVEAEIERQLREFG